MTSSKFLTLNKAIENIEHFENNFRIIFYDQIIYQKWKELIIDYDVKGKQIFDCNLVATMITNDIKKILINDDGFKRYDKLISIIPLT